MKRRGWLLLLLGLRPEPGLDGIWLGVAPAGDDNDEREGNVPEPHPPQNTKAAALYQIQLPGLTWFSISEHLYR